MPENHFRSHFSPFRSIHNFFFKMAKDDHFHSPILTKIRGRSLATSNMKLMHTWVHFVFQHIWLFQHIFTKWKLYGTIASDDEIWQFYRCTCIYNNIIMLIVMDTVAYRNQFCLNRLIMYGYCVNYIPEI